MNAVVSADLRSSGPLNYRGCLDGFEPDTGLLGWAINLKEPAERLPLRFQIDGMTAFELVTCDPRYDVSLALDRPDVKPGFCIPRSELSRLAPLIALRPAAAFSVEIGTTSLFLPRTETVGSLQAVVSSVVEGQRSIRRQTESLERLALTKQDAEPLALLPLRPFEDTRAGFIEAICTEDQGEGLTWVIGWAFGSDLQDAPVVLVDGRKHPGAIVAGRYPRPDLPADAAGFVAVVHSAWRARQTSKPILYFGPSVRHHLMSVADLPRVSKHDILAYVLSHRTADSPASWSDLYSLLRAGDSWLRQSDDQHEVHLSVDDCIVVPLLGYFVSGWVLSTSRAVESFALKVGSLTLAMDAASLAIRPRPDLVSAFPNAATMAERAGFTCFFPGHPEPSSAEPPLLKVSFDQGPSTVHSIGAAHVRRLTNTAPLDVLLRLYPNLETERFFPSLVSAVRQDYLDRSSQFDIAVLRASKQAVLVAVPSERDDCFLVMEEIRHNAPCHLGSDTGLIFIAGSSHKHGDLTALFRELSSDLPMPCSLIFVPEILAALYVLKDILLIASADRFCYIAANEVLTPEGWKALATFVRTNQGRAIAFESIDPEFSLGSRDRAASFGCDWDTFIQLCPKPKVMVNLQLSALDFLGDMLQSDEDVVKGGAFLTRKTISGRVATLINRFDRVPERDSTL